MPSWEDQPPLARPSEDQPPLARPRWSGPTAPGTGSIRPSEDAPARRFLRGTPDHRLPLQGRNGHGGTDADALGPGPHGSGTPGEPLGPDPREITGAPQWEPTPVS